LNESLVLEFSAEQIKTKEKNQSTVN